MTETEKQDLEKIVGKSDICIKDTAEQLGTIDSLAGFALKNLMKERNLHEESQRD